MAHQLFQLGMVVLHAWISRWQVRFNSRIGDQTLAKATIQVSLKTGLRDNLILIALWTACSLFATSAAPIEAGPLPADGLNAPEVIPDEKEDYTAGLLALPEQTEALNLYCKTVDLTILRRFKNLKRLDIGGPDDYISSKAMDTLTTLPIESMFVRADRMDASVPAVIGRFKSLKHLALISHWKEVPLKKLANITDLEGLHLEAPVVGSIADLAKCKKLRYLRIANAGAKTETLKSDDSVMRGISRVPQLQELCVTLSTLSRPVLQEICSLPNLRSLDVSAMNLTDDDMKIIGQTATLEKLNLRDNPITDAGVRHLTSLKNLRALRLTNTAISDAAFADLGNLTKLEELDVMGTKTNGSGLPKLQDLKQLRNLTLSAVVNRNLEPLKNFATLEYLDLRAATLSGNGAKFVAEAPKLRVLRVGRFDTDRAIRQLRSAPSLESAFSETPVIKGERAELPALKTTKDTTELLIGDRHDIRDWTCF